MPMSMGTETKSPYMQICSVVQLLSHVWLFATPWTAARQASLSITISWSLLKLMSIEAVMPSNHLILCQPLLLLPSIFSSIRIFYMSWLFIPGSHSIGASASVFPMNIQGWFPLALMGLISLLCKRLSRVFSSITVWKHHFCIRVTCNLLWKWILRVVMKCKLIDFIDIWLEFSMYLFAYIRS